MLNILYYYSSQQIYTGSPRVLIKLIDGLDRSLYNPLFFSNARGDLCDTLEKLDTKIIFGKVSIVSKSSILINIFNIIKLIIVLIKNRINIIHINELGWNSEIVFAAWLCRVPIFFHIHNLEKFKKNNYNCIFGAKYFFVSNFLLEQCGARKIVKDKAKVIYNPIDIDYFSGGRSIRDQLNISVNTYVVGTVAQISSRKGIDIFIETANKILAKMPDVKFLIVGPDAIREEDYASNLRAFVNDSPFRDNISFLGPRNDIPNILASLDIFFLPTRAEPFGLVIAEAMAASVPVVCSNVGGILEIIPSQEYGVTKNLSDDDWHIDIISLLKDKNKRIKISEAAHSRVASEFSNVKFNKKIDFEYKVYN